MMTEAIITVILCWLVACIVLPALMGALISFYEDCTYEKDFGHPNLHGLYFIIRCFICLPFSWVVYQQCSLVIDSFWLWVFCGMLFFFSSVALCWSLFYNGIQYMGRNQLSENRVYKKGFFSEKEHGPGDKHNKAFINLSFKARLIWFCVGTLFVFGIILTIIHP